MNITYPLRYYVLGVVLHLLGGCDGVPVTVFRGLPLSYWSCSKSEESDMLFGQVHNPYLHGMGVSNSSYLASDKKKKGLVISVPENTTGSVCNCDFATVTLT
jgi:hypothetical protein